MFGARGMQFKKKKKRSSPPSSLSLLPTPTVNLTYPSTSSSQPSLLDLLLEVLQELKVGECPLAAVLDQTLREQVAGLAVLPDEPDWRRVGLPPVEEVHEGPQSLRLRVLQLGKLRQGRLVQAVDTGTVTRAREGGRGEKCQYRACSRKLYLVFA